MGPMRLVPASQCGGGDGGSVDCLKRVLGTEHFQT